MASFTNLSVALLLLTILFPTLALCYINPAATSVHQNATKPSAYHAYIVLVEPPRSNAGEDAHRQWHKSFLPSSLTGESNESRLLHSYTEVFSGFAVRLTDAELDLVAKKPGFVRAFPDRTLQLMTTHTPEFLGLRNDTGFWSQAGYGKGVIIGLLDTGIYATHPSFNDHGVPPPPARWKGSCKAARCNNKLIGAKSFIKGVDSGDEEGHGTHTSSTAAGNFVTGASYHGVGKGTAAGIAPSAHIAMYKVCDSRGCEESAVLAGLEEAIKDGVDVLSFSLGGTMSPIYDQDPIAIGAFSAMSKGILMVCAAGNDGPDLFSVTNVAPWLLTVAAGSVDRSFGAGVNLGNGKIIDGEALTQKASPSSKSHPLVYSEERRYCNYSDDSGITGKILVCENTKSETQQSNVRRIVGAGASGVVLFNDEISGYTTIVQDYNSSVVQVTASDGGILKAYAASSKSSFVASLTYNNTLFGVRPAPVVPFFSSRGPSFTNLNILKPDILAPGLNILAAWPPSTASGQGPFNIISGTSMATPHVSGVAALIKSIHPDWSPAAIKSAILTTSDIVNSTGGSILDEQHRKARVFDTGAGHVNPARAADPGLVYDLSVTEYAGYICWFLGDSGLATIVRNSSLTCGKLPKVQHAQLNYPTITVLVSSTPFTVNRTVTNVGPADSTFKAKVDVPRPLTVRVSPETLSFSKAGEKKTFSMSVSGDLGKEVLYVEGSLSWVSERHVVRSPIVALPASSP
ncbi:subtilisin-like protease [Aegilops tauschii subsp. strangulata]|nr:subtilisin-like protease [Aegilops tauschii subsp. strangulata]